MSRTVNAWMGTATTSVREAVVISAVHVNPGRTSGTGSSMVTTTLSWWPAPCWLQPGRGACLDWAVANLGDVTLERSVWYRVDGHDCGLAERDRRDVGLVHFDFGLDERHVGNGQQHRAGVVHRADDHVFTFFDVPAGDDAVHRRVMIT